VCVEIHVHIYGHCEHGHAPSVTSKVHDHAGDVRKTKEPWKRPAPAQDPHGDKGASIQGNGTGAHAPPAPAKPDPAKPAHQ
jgi:hypothetical protein